MKREIVRTLVVIIVVYSLLHAQISYSWNDFMEGATPPNPPTGTQRMYLNGTTHLITVIKSDGSTFSLDSGIPAGTIVMTLSACPAGYSEVAALNGNAPLGTLAANMNVGTTGGSDSITPVGTNSTAAFTPAGSSAAPTVVSLTAAAQTISGSTAAEASHTHSVTAAGTNGTVTGPAQTISWPAGVPTLSGTTINSFTPTINAPGAIAWPASVPTAAGNAATTATGSSGAVKPTATHTHTISWPAAVPTISGTTINSVTPTINSPGTIAWPAGVPTNSTSTIPAEVFTGSPVTSGAGSSHLHGVGSLANAASAVTGTLAAGAFTGTPGTVPAEVFSGTSFDNRSAFVRVIFCEKT